MSRRDDLFDRVMRRVRFEPGPKPDCCWIWTGPTSGDGRGGGYPRMSLDGQTVAVHRVMAVHRFGYLPASRQVDHTCRNRLCVNPNHLEPVTHKENQRRRDAANNRNEDA
ncbi:MAG: HNH endonuclease signature motif containing protein [Pseudomonadota bacterium]